MPLPDNFNAALYNQKWGADTSDTEERLFLASALRTNGAKLVDALRTADTDDKRFNEACHDLARTVEERMVELAKWGDL
jgi:hypothetical protein